MINLKLYFAFFCFFAYLNIFSQNIVGDNKIQTITNDPIPTVLLTFDAIFDNTKVELTWASNSENNNNFFVIEKSKDAMNFESVTSVKAFGNNSNIISYFDVDYLPFDGISYYRLTQINEKGKKLTSRLVSINNKVSSNNLSMNNSAVYDTPASLMGSENNEVLVVLRNDKGEETHTKVVIDTQNNVISSDASSKLENGVYTVVASSDNKLHSQKLVVK
ncbi:MAG: hypothetical protein V4565_08765 [Bacteroidota bacterium]